MQIDNLDFSAEAEKVIISDGQDQYANVFYPTITPVCDDAEDCFALLDRSGGGFLIDRLFIYHEDAQIKMLVKNLRTKVLCMVNFSANVLQKQKGKRKSGIIIKHPLFNGFICRAIDLGREGKQIWAVYRPFLISNCSTQFSEFDPDPPSDGKAFYDKYLKITYDFPQAQEDPMVIYKIFRGEVKL